MGREKRKMRTIERESIDAAFSGGSGHSSIEVSVMEMERRTRIISFAADDNQLVGRIIRD